MPQFLMTRRTFGLAVGASAAVFQLGDISMAQTLTAEAGPKPETVSFPSGDGTVVAHLYLPEGYDPSRRYPAVAVGGSFASVKEQMGGIYGFELARRGVIALAIDYRNYGESSGAVRQYEDPESKAVDLSSALKFLRSRSDVSGTGLLGVCTSGGTALYTAAMDPDVGAVATVAGFFPGPALQKLLQGEGGVERHRAEGAKAKTRYEESGVIETIRAYHNTDKTASSVGPMGYYMDPARGGGVREWRNAFAVMAWGPMLDFDPVPKASKVTAPTLIVHSDGSAFPDEARKVYEQLAGPKDLYWATGAHFDFYDQSAQVQDAADRVAEHFRAKLS